jgi:hypothetical protein
MFHLPGGAHRPAFRANITGNLADIEELTWNFGDDAGTTRTFPPDGNEDGDDDPTTTSFTYQSVPADQAS